jgi:hypothetical protein
MTGLTERDFGDVANALTGSMSSAMAQEVSSNALTHATSVVDVVGASMGDNASAGGGGGGGGGDGQAEMQNLARKLLESGAGGGGGGGGRGKDRNGVVKALAEVMGSRSAGDMEMMFRESSECRTNAISAISKELLNAQTPHQQRDLMRMLTGGDKGTIKQNAAFLAAILGDTQMQSVLKPAWGMLNRTEKERLLPKEAQCLSEDDLQMLLHGYLDKYGDQALSTLVEILQSRFAGKPEEMLKMLLLMVRGSPMSGKEGKAAMAKLLEAIFSGYTEKEKMALIQSLMASLSTKNRDSLLGEMLTAAYASDPAKWRSYMAGVLKEHSAKNGGGAATAAAAAAAAAGGGAGARDPGQMECPKCGTEVNLSEAGMAYMLEGGGGGATGKAGANGKLKQAANKVTANTKPSKGMKMANNVLMKKALGAEFSMPSYWERFLKGMKKSNGKEIPLSRLRVMIFQFYLEKPTADEAARVSGSQPPSLIRFVTESLLFKYGTKKLVQSRIFSLISSVNKHCKKDHFVRTFARFCELVDPLGLESFEPYLSSLERCKTHLLPTPGNEKEKLALLEAHDAENLMKGLCRYSTFIHYAGTVHS